MSVLQPDPSELGLWRSAPQGTAGAHAIIIGVSDYPFLAGGALHNFTPDDYGMGQLFVSAKTAASMFDWLRDRGRFAGQELISCRLLLGPSDGEEQFIKNLIGTHFGPTDFASMRAATEAWSKEFLRAPPADAKKNVSIFFFSGHGLEHAASPSLLAQDFLEPIGEAGIGHAMAFVPLRDALKTYNINHGFYFLDACRNVPESLKGKDPVGQSFLRPQSNSAISPTSVMWLTATSNGNFAYQPPSSAEPATYFGQSLLEGLRGIPPELKPYNVAKAPSELSFEALEDYAKERTRQLVQDIDPGLDQPVKASGDPHEDDTILATLDIGHHPMGPPPPIPPPSPPAGPGDLPPFAPGGVSIKDFAIISARAHRFRENLSAPINVRPSIKGVPPSRQMMHDGFGHEWISDGWERSVSFTTINGVDILASIGRVQTTDGEFVVSSLVDVVIKPASLEHDTWIGLGGRGTHWPHLGILVPGDNGPIPLRLKLSFVRDEHGQGQLSAMSARVGPPLLLKDVDDPQLVKLWTGLWEVQERETFSTLGKALDTIDVLAKSEFALFEKARSPAAAAIGASTLLRAGQLERLHDWPRNLANWFNSSDGAMIWAEIQFRTNKSAFQREAIEYFNKIADWGPPRLRPVLDAAVQRLAYLKKNVHPKAREILEHAASISRPDGLFAGFGSFDWGFEARDLFNPPAPHYIQLAASEEPPETGDM